MNIQSINAKAWLFTAAFAILLCIQFFVQYNAQSTAKNELVLLHEKQLTMVHHAYSLKNATIQVQKLMTNISATRGLDGLNNGLEQATDERRSFQQAVDKLISLDPQNARQYESLMPIFKEYVKTGSTMARSYVEEGSNGGNKLMVSFNQDAQKTNELVDTILKRTHASMNKGLLNSIKSLEADSTYLIIFTILFIVLLASLIVANKVILSTPMAKLADIIKMMAVQQKETGSVSLDTVNLNTNIKTELGAIAYWLTDLLSDISKQNKEASSLANDNKRIKDALDACSTNVMMADNDLNIVYMNTAVQGMMKTAEADLQKELPNFNANNLMGQNIDVFHKNPAHQRGMLDKLQQTYKTQITVGERTFGLIATPIFSETRERLGTVVEWADKTAEIKLNNEKELQQQEMATAALETKRISDALDACSTNVMMADADLNIVYMNPAVLAMMQDAEADLKKELPDFNANNLIGQNIDVFHKNPAHQRGMLAKLQNTYKTQISVGVRTFSLIATPIFNEDKTRLGTVVEWADKTQEVKHNQEKELQQQKMARAALETKRISDALDACSTNVMMADAEFNIVYMNPAVLNMMRTAETDLKKELPNFNANDLIGQNIDVFHKNPAHQRSMLSRLTETYKTVIQVGARTFSLIATPIYDDERNRLGTVVEWADKTSEVHIEKEVANLIAAANSGDLTKRLDTQGQKGFANTLSMGLNELMDKISGFVTDVGIIFEGMSEGNLTKNISNSYQGELEKIKTNANDSISKLSEVLSKIQSASDIVRTSSNEVAQGSDDLSRRTESQASSLEETAASMEEITATVKQTAESATQSNSLASEAKQKAEKGGDVVQGAVKAMGEIMDSSNKINDIIGVIDEIAFQTNLLALNAAVEAARAGEQGRGFAVVAGEVRTLSQRSAAAAKEIKDLIRDSVNKVESGSNLVNQSGQMLSEIVQAVDKVARMISDVNNAAIEQNSGISQINQAITQMDEMTQQNAALVEETSAASRSMSEEANSMNRLISFFQLGRNTNHLSSTSHSTNEPIQTYQSSAPTAPSQTKPSGDSGTSGSSGAASFSNGDDWEDF